MYSDLIHSTQNRKHFSHSFWQSSQLRIVIKCQYLANIVLQQVGNQIACALVINKIHFHFTDVIDATELSQAVLLCTFPLNFIVFRIRLMYFQ